MTSVSPTADVLPPGDASPVPGFTSPPVDSTQDFLSTEAYLQEQIKELDAQFDALNAAYRQGKREREIESNRFFNAILF